MSDDWKALAIICIGVWLASLAGYLTGALALHALGYCL